jgi:hypothetical protein
MPLAMMINSPYACATYKEYLQQIAENQIEMNVDPHNQDWLVSAVMDIALTEQEWQERKGQYELIKRTLFPDA